MAHRAVHEADCCRADENSQKAVGRFGEGAAPRSRAGLCVADEPERRQRSGAGPTWSRAARPR